MALSAVRLSAAIKADLLGNEDSGAVDNDALTRLCDVIAAAVIEEITTHAELVVDVTSVSGVTTGGGVSGPGSGTGTIT